MPYCTKCGGEYSDRQNYCTKCGCDLFSQKNAVNTSAQKTEEDKIKAEPVIKSEIKAESANDNKTEIKAEQQVKSESEIKTEPKDETESATKTQPITTAPKPTYTYTAPIKPPKGSEYAPVGIGTYIGSLILFSIPVIGFIVCLIWACGGVKNKNLLNYSRAVLILMAIGVILAILTSVLVALGCSGELTDFYHNLCRLFNI